MSKPNIIFHANEVLKTVSKRTDKVILFYSGGKDSLALLHLCSKHFKEVVCVFMYLVKDLQHINKYLKYAETYENVRVLQVPHWNLTYILKDGLYCAANPKIKLMKLADVDEAVRMQTGIKFSVFGFKMADSMNRRLMLKTYELEAIHNTKVYPLSYWKDADVLRYLEMNRIPKPINYDSKKRSSGVGFDLEVFLYLRKNYPGDLSKILTQFPLAEKILFDYDQENRKSKLI